MAEFYPSEIARLVLGYLKEVHCPNSWQSFLDESSDLHEHKRLYTAGKFCTTNVNGKSLLDILAEYCTLKNAANENNQKSCSTNTYQIYGVYKTPNKVNESSFTSFRINQKIQTQSVVSANRSTLKSPSGRGNLFTSPTSRPVCRTPRRRLDCNAVNLDFGPEVDSVNEKNISSLSASKRALFSSVTASTNQGVKRKILVSTDNRSSCNSNFTANSQILNESSKISNDELFERDDNTAKENVPLSSPDNQKTCVNSSPRVPAASESVPNDVQCPSTSNTPNSKSSEIETFNQHSQIGTSTSAATSLQNVMYQSSNLITNAENVSVSLMESCSTPQYEVDPPPYNRAPNTNSPRIVLSHDRSLLASLTTPVKDKRAYLEEEWSPKRKGCIPRRRLLSESPMAKLNHQYETAVTFDTMIESLFAPDEVLFNDPLVQLLTENINKVKQCEFKESDFFQDGDLDDIVKKAAEYTEEDPAFERFLQYTISGNSTDAEKDETFVQQMNEVSDDASYSSVRQEAVHQNVLTSECVIQENDIETDMEVVEESQNTVEDDTNKNKDKSLDTQGRVEFNSVATLNGTSVGTETNSSCTQIPNGDNLTSGILPVSDMDKNLNSARCISDKIVEKETTETDSLNNFTKNPNKGDNLACSIPPVIVMDKDLNSARSVSDKIIENEMSETDSLKNFTENQAKDDNLTSSVHPVGVMDKDLTSAVCNLDKITENGTVSDSLQTNSSDPCIVSSSSEVNKHVDGNEPKLNNNNDEPDLCTENLPNSNASSTKQNTGTTVTDKFLNDKEIGLSIETKLKDKDQSQNVNADTQNSPYNLQNMTPSTADLAEPQNITSQVTSATQSQNIPVDTQSSINSQVFPNVNASITNLAEPQIITSQVTNIAQSQNTPFDTLSSINSQVFPNVNASITNLAEPQIITSQVTNIAKSQNTPTDTLSSINSQVFPNVNASITNLAEPQIITSQVTNIAQSQNTPIDTLSSINSQVFPNVNASNTNLTKPMLITPQMTNQPNALIEMSLPSLPAVLMSSVAPDGTIQSNLYRFVINTPISFNSPSVNGVCLPLPSTLPLPTTDISSSIIVTPTPTTVPLPTTDISSPMIVTPAPTTVPMFNVEHSANTIINSNHAGNISVLGVSGAPDLHSRFSHNKDDIIPSEVTTPSNTVKKSTKRKKSTKSASEDLVDKNSDQPLSSSSASSLTATAKRRAKRCNQKRTPKRKPLSLFSSSPTVEANTTPTKNEDSDIPVLSIPESSMSSDQSSAFKLLSRITGQIETFDKSPRVKNLEKNPKAKTLERSPLLKNLIKKAAALVDKPSRISSAHVRCLDFDSDSGVQNDNDSQIHNIKSKMQSNISVKSAVPHRRSPRIQHTKGKGKLTEPKSINEDTNKLDKNPSVDCPSSFNERDPNSIPLKVSSKQSELSAFSKVLDLFHCENVPILDDDIGMDSVNSNVRISPKNSPKMLHTDVACPNKALAVENSSTSQQEQNKSVNENLNMHIDSPEKNKLVVVPQESDAETDLNEKQEILSKQSDSREKLNNSRSSYQNIVSENVQEQHEINKSEVSLEKESKTPAKVSSVSTSLLSVNSNLEKYDVNNKLNDSKKIKNGKISKQAENKKKSEKVVSNSYKSMSYAIFGSDSDFTPEKNCDFAHKMSPQVSSPYEGINANIQKKNNKSGLETEKGLSDITEKKIISSPNQNSTVFDCTSKHEIRKEEIDLSLDNSYTIHFFHNTKSQNSPKVPSSVIDEKSVECVEIEKCFENGEQVAKPSDNVILDIKQPVHKCDESGVKSCKNNEPVFSNERAIKCINQETTPQLSLISKNSSKILARFSKGENFIDTHHIECCVESLKESVAANVNDKSIALPQPSIQQSPKSCEKSSSKIIRDNLKLNKKCSMVEQINTAKYSPKSSISLKQKNPSPKAISDNDETCSLESAPQLSVVSKRSSQICGISAKGRHRINSLSKESVAENENHQRMPLSQSETQQSPKTHKKLSPKSNRDNLKINEKCSVVEQIDTNMSSHRSFRRFKPNIPPKKPQKPSEDLSPKSNRDNLKTNEESSLLEHIDTNKCSPRTSSSFKAKNSSPKIIGGNLKQNENCSLVEQTDTNMHSSKSSSLKSSKEKEKTILTHSIKQTKDTPDSANQNMQVSTNSTPSKKHKIPVSSPATSVSNICDAVINTSHEKEALSKEKVETASTNSKKQQSSNKSCGVDQKMLDSANSMQFKKHMTPISSPAMPSPSYIYDAETNASNEKGTLKYGNIYSEKPNKEMNTVLPPPKKRIRPIPVDSLSNESFAAFNQFTDITETGGRILAENQARKELSGKKENFKITKPDSVESKDKSICIVNSHVSDTVTKSTLSVSEKTNVNNLKSFSNSVPVLSNSMSPLKQFASNLQVDSPSEGKSLSKVNSPVLDTVAKSTLSVSESSNVDHLKSFSNSVPPHSDSMSPLKQFASNLQVTSPTSKTPITKTPATKTPVEKTPPALFKQPWLWKSGKPKALFDFYMKAHPDKEGDLPISPLSFSNSSCTTLDGFSAKRKLIDDSSTTSVEVQQNNTLNTSVHDKQKDCEIIGESVHESDINSVKQKKMKSNTADMSSEVSSEKLNPCFSSFDELKHVEENTNKTFPHDDEDFEENNEDFLSKVKRKRKRSDSSLSDTCSTVVDLELEVETPVKNDEWLKKPLFSISPISKRSRKISESSSDYESSPEKMESFKCQQDFTSTDKVQNSLSEQVTEVLLVEQSCVNKSCEVQLNDAENISPQNELLQTSTKSLVTDSSTVKKTNLSTILEKSAKKDAVKEGHAKKLRKQSAAELRDSSRIKEKSISPVKKERRSRPSLKITAFKSPCKKKLSEKKKTSPSNFTTEKSDCTKKDSVYSAQVKTNDSLEKSVLKLNDNMEIKTKFHSDQENMTAVSGETAIPSNPVTDLKMTSAVSKESHEVLDLCETTRDIVESDIGRSNEEGSELAIAIANCQRELLMKSGTNDSLTNSNFQHSAYQTQDELTEREMKSYTKEESEKHEASSSFQSSICQMDTDCDKNKEMTIDDKDSETGNLQTAHNSQSPIYPSGSGSGCSKSETSVSENQNSKVKSSEKVQTSENPFPEEVRSDPRFHILMEKLKSVGKDKIARLFKHLTEDQT